MLQWWLGHLIGCAGCINALAFNQAPVIYNIAILCKIRGLGTVMTTAYSTIGLHH
jgi:hypothetical protein